MRIDRALIQDELLYDVMYFSPVEVGGERYSSQLYFQTDIYARKMPQVMVDMINSQIEELRHVEMGIVPFDDAFRVRHREIVLGHCKMALAYLDAREARISMKLCELCEPATKSNEPSVMQHPDSDLYFLRVCVLSVKACAARRIKFFQKAVDALSEAKTICTHIAEESRAHPLAMALTLLNLSAILGDLDHDKHGLRQGLDALSLLYNSFSILPVPEVVEAYYLALACHNAALLNVKLGRLLDAAELFEEGIELTKKLPSEDDGIRSKLIAVGAVAKRLPEAFLTESIDALNGWGEHGSAWDISFWDFTVPEIQEEIKVLRLTKTLKRLVVGQIDNSKRRTIPVEESQLVRLILAILKCHSLERVIIAGLEFEPRKVWRRVRKPSFLETSWYKTHHLTYQRRAQKEPDVADYRGLLAGMDTLSKKLVLLLVILGNECEGVDLSEIGLDPSCTSALAHALRTMGRPRFTRQVSTLILQSNGLDAGMAAELATAWDPCTPMGSLPVSELPSHAGSATPSEIGRMTPGSEELHISGEAVRLSEEARVTSLDISRNIDVGDSGFESLITSIGRCEAFHTLVAHTIGLHSTGCRALHELSSTRLEVLDLSNNALGSEGVRIVATAVPGFIFLRALLLDGCSADGRAASSLSEAVSQHPALARISLNRNSLGSDGATELCLGAAHSSALRSLHLAENEICTEQAALAIGELMRGCLSLEELGLSGNPLHPRGMAHIGAAIEYSKVLVLRLEAVGLSGRCLDDFLDNGAAETQELQVLALSRNAVGDEGLVIISECLSIGLMDLALSECNLTAASQATLLNLVSLSPNLRRLDLSKNGLGPSACTDMVSWMTKNAKECYSLRWLELANCNLGDEGFTQLVPIMASLTYLGARENGITSLGLVAVMKANQMIQLDSLDLSSNQIDDDGVVALTERFQKEHKKAQYVPKQLNSTIDTVILAGNPVSKSFKASIEAFMRVHNPLLTVVW
mmetsp:Transcript_69658/g.137865  ORF Transcript_69658/g.137865 Transcript_69658/m.137865 type:complete len:980 (+) Transcript_69658:67-3006(+)|eukprot:CAMPEP_0172663654 /NCGR_PEP_ID=MMETSP1074-20121228/6076_1 /TAXON_ID=2916 /ORGANISM="Ceratium fusus, Strain PA161109" /LENGTH=979 /DNA_ID=CAMNT_0013479685 /DNA_START=65 /DNA_END=3004 /DNA_ORIENTATION=+